MRNKKRALVIGLSSLEYERVAAQLQEVELDVDRFPSGLGALELATFLPIDLMLIRSPLPDLEVDELLLALRSGASESRGASIVLLAERGFFATSLNFVGRGANRLISLESPALDLPQILFELLSVAPRRQVRFQAQLNAHLGGRPTRLLGCARNGSMSGVLIESTHKLPRGSLVDFEFKLNGSAVRGQGEVVRHTTLERERVDGMGLRIISFADDSLETYQRFLANRRLVDGRDQL